MIFNKSKIQLSGYKKGVINRFSVVSSLWIPIIGKEFIHGKFMNFCFISLLFLLFYGLLYLILRRIVSKNEISPARNKRIYISFSIIMLTSILSILLLDILFYRSATAFLVMLLPGFLIPLGLTKWIFASVRN